MNNSSIKNFFYVSLGRIIPGVLQSIFYLIFAYILEPQIYGELSYMISIAGVASVLSRFGLPYTITIFSAKKKFIYVNQLHFLLIILSSIASVSLIFIDVTAALLSFSLSLFGTNQYFLLGIQKYKKFMFNAILKSTTLIIIPIILYFVLEIPGILLGMAISNFLCSFNFLSSLKREIKKFKDLKENFQVLLHNFGVDSSSALPRLADKLVIVPLLGFASTGIYQFNLQILFALEIFPLTLHSFLLPEESSGRVHNKIFYLVILMSFLIILVVIALAPFIISELFPKYFEGVTSLQLLILSIMPLSIAAILNAKLQALESTRIGYSGIVRVGSLLLLLWILGGLYDLMGLSMAVLASNILYVIFLTILYAKYKC